MQQFDFQKLYRSALSENDFEPDSSQLEAVVALDSLAQSLLQESARRWWQRLRDNGPAQRRRGLYLWGGVGRGKTYLMDLFFNNLPVRRKYRVHFHRFMRQIHAELKHTSNTADPLATVAKRLAEQYRLICLDEFFVHDIGDAMILGRLLRGLFERHVVLVTTSNSPPAQLYRDGLQRQRFMPAIALLEKHCCVTHIDGGIDYRLRALESAAIFLSPNDANAQARLSELFARINPGSVRQNLTIDIEGRPIQSVRCGKGIAWFEFSAICDGPRSQNDYIELARLFHTVLIEDMPVLTAELDDQTRRFISLVDEFYDRRVKLILSAATGIDSLYQGNRLAFEFRRSASRLIEMQSHDYLGLAHLA